MKIRGHGNAVAIALGGLAVVLAATGTAYAVTATTVHIADPSSPKHVARVDAAGRLSTTGALTSIDESTFVFPGDGARAVLSPTKASLGITYINYDSSFNRPYPNTDYSVELDKITVGSSGHCSDADATVTRLRLDSLPQAGTVNEAFPFPILVKPTAGKAFCVGVTVAFTDTTHPSSYVAAYIAIGAYVASGSYSGLGLNNPGAPQTSLRPEIRRSGHQG